MISRLGELTALSMCDGKKVLDAGPPPAPAFTLLKIEVVCDYRSILMAFLYSKSV